MRIYDLDKNFDKLIEDGEYQIETVGEAGGWTVTVSSRKWSNELQRYVYDEIGACTTHSFLHVYDFAMEIVFRENRCSLGFDMTE